MSSAPGRLTRHDLSLVVVSLIWGGNYTISKIALGHVSPALYAAIRFTLSTCLLFGALWFLRRAQPVSRRTALTLLGWGVVGHTLNQLCFLNGLKLTTATNSALIFGNLPVVVAVLGMISGQERPRPRVWAGILLGTLGVALVVGGQGAEFSRATLTGDAFNVVGLLLWAAYTIGIRKAAVGLNALQVSAYAHLGGTPGLILFAIPDLATVPLTSLSSAVWVGILYSALLSSMVASVLWTRSLKALGGSRTALYNCLTPVVAGAIAWAALGEEPLPLQLLGAALVVVGVLVSRPPPAPSPVSRLPAS